MDNTYFKFTCNTTKIFYDSFTEFSNGYNDAADLIVSTIFAKYGLYDIVKHTTTEADMIKYGDIRFNLQASYIWSHLHEVSDILRCSYLYRTTHKSLSYMLSFNDMTFSKTIKSFKQDIIEYIQKHSMFLAYCDLENSGLLLYTNPDQALHKDRFVTNYNQTFNDIQILHNKYKGRISKVVLSILQEIKAIIDVRELNEERLILPTNERMFSRCLPSFDKNLLNEVIFNFEKCDINKLHQHMEILYSNLSLLHVISSIDWLLFMQGKAKCLNCKVLLRDFITMERLDYLKFIENTMCSDDTPVMKQELTRLNFLKKAFKSLRNKNLLQNYSLDTLGYNSSFIIANATRLYNNNIKLIIYADLLFTGFYDIVDRQYLPSYEHIDSIINKAEKDLNELITNTTTDIMEHRIFSRTTYTFCQSLKKMKRFSTWLKTVQCDNLQQEQEMQEGIDFIFGNVVDKDGQPSICPICLDSSIERKDTWWKINPCCHTIHLDCYNNLFETEHCVCPMCRVKIT